MKVWVFITGDGYYGGWFFGVWETEEKAIKAVESAGWKFSNGEWQKDGLDGELAEVEMNQMWRS